MFVTLKDGSKTELENGLTALEVTKHISEGLARAALVAKADGKFVSMNEVIEERSDVYFNRCLLFSFDVLFFFVSLSIELLCEKVIIETREISDCLVSVE